MPRSVVLLLASLTLTAPALFAQSNAEINAGVQFNFRPPGARSLGLGGAFAAVADDATAAYVNPAGLGAISRPEVSLEVRNTEFTTTFTDRGNAAEPSGFGVDNVAGLVSGESRAAATGPAFAAVVYPSGRFAVALYVHELSRFRAAYETQGAFGHSNLRAFPTRNEMRLDIASYGLAASLRLSERFSIGGGLSLHSLGIDSQTDRFQNGFVDDTEVGGFYGIPDYSLLNLTNFQVQKGSDTAVAVNAGLLVKVTRTLTLGAVYRGGPDFWGVRVETRPGPRAGGHIPVRQESGFRVPDAFALGLALRPSDRWLVAAEAVHVRFSQRLDHFVDVFGFGGEADPDDFALDDGTELHAGLEYVLADMARPIVLRAGVWLEPDNRIRWVGPPLQDDVTPIFFRGGEATVHAAFGLGWVAGARFQIDGAADLSDRSNTWTASAVLRF